MLRDEDADPQARRRGTAIVSIRSFSSDARAVSAARALLGRFAGAISGEALCAARLAVSELVTNAVEHSPAGQVEVRVQVTRQALRVEVADAGVEPFRETISSPSSLRGRGLLLVAAFSDRWGIERSPNTVAWFEIDHAERHVGRGELGLTPA